MRTKLNLFIATAAFTAFSFSASAQNANDWINVSPESGVYGLGVDKAYDFIAKNKLKAKVQPIVALIGTGIDAEHEALSANMWVNKKEKVDGKDNDGNGYVDDINGWNFLGGKDGAVMEKTLREGDREFLRLGEKYADLFFDGKRYFKYARNKVERIYVDAPADMEEYNYFVKSIQPESMIYKNTYEKMCYLLREYVHIFDQKMKAKYPEKTDFSMEDLASLWDKTGPQDEVQNTAMWGIGLYLSNNPGKKWKDCFEMYSGENYIKFCSRNGTADMTRAAFAKDGRKEIVGDNIYDIKDKNYGNNVLLTANAAVSTMAGGIIAGKRGVEGRNNPIAENAQIMAINVSGSAGEPYLKDMALGIRYAVDNGASVIVLCQQNSLYAPQGKTWMTEAIRYAESKGILVIVPAWELSHDLDQKTFYPNRFMAADGKELTNLMVVSPSDKTGKPVVNSNYGVKNVDLYAPGVSIMAPAIGDAYQTGSTTFFAAATTAGTAALIKTYFPALTSKQLRSILMENCTSRKGVEVEKGIRINGKNSQDVFLFEQLCTSGGILNAEKAFEAASKVTTK